MISTTAFIVALIVSYAATNRGNPHDDMKSAAGEVYAAARNLLQLTAAGSDTSAFAKFTLAPLVQPGMSVYAALKADILARNQPLDA